MDKVENVLKKYFEELKSRPYHSNLSWENCYKFFYENRDEFDKVDEKSELIEKAALHLAFYLASWGMYRGDTFLRQYDHSVYKGLIIDLLNKYSNFYDKEFVDWENLKNAKNDIIEYFKNLKRKDKKYKNEPTKTLITKILMGIFGCVPAYDRFVKRALQEYSREHSHKRICQTFNDVSYNTLKDWWEQYNCSEQHHLKGSTITYPPMKLVDVYFWSEGKRLDEEDAKIRRKNNDGRNN